MWVTAPIVSAEANFLTKLFSFYILALEKLSEIVTAKGRPSGIATTITVIAMMIVFNNSVKNLFLKSNTSRGMHPFGIFLVASLGSAINGGGSQEMRFLHPQLMTPEISKMSLIKIATKVKPAHA